MTGCHVWGAGTMDLVVGVVIDCRMVLKCVVDNCVACCSMVVVLK